MLFGDRAQPGGIIVDSRGRRFANEAANYNDFGRAMHEFDPAEYTFPRVPSWFIFDADRRARYTDGPLDAANRDPDWLRAGRDYRGARGTDRGASPDAARDASSATTVTPHAASTWTSVAARTPGIRTAPISPARATSSDRLTAAPYLRHPGPGWLPRDQRRAEDRRLRTRPAGRWIRSRFPDCTRRATRRPTHLAWPTRAVARRSVQPSCSAG